MNNNSKKIYINGRFLLRPPTGVNRFAYEICKSLVHLGLKVTLICPVGNINKEYDLELLDIRYYGLGPSHFWEQVVLPTFFLGKSRYVLLNFTGLGPVLIFNKIITIHDLAFLHNPSWYSLPYYLLYKLLTPICAQTAKKVLTVSNFSKSEIIKFLKIEAGKIEVIYNAVPSVFYNKVVSVNPTETTQQYILAVSSLDPRKNFDTLLKAFALLVDLPIRLFIIGGKNRIYNHTITSSSDDRVVWLGRVSDEELIQYYQHAQCFIYPSLYEGFGIPPLEAMILGCPVIASDIAVFHEIYGTSVVYVNPVDEIEIAAKIRFLLGNASDKAKLKNLGEECARSYSWQESALKIKEILSVI